MFNVNDTVVYGASGVCVISEVKEMEVHGFARAYYVLDPVDSAASRVFIPVENKNLTSKIKRIMSKDEAISMLNDKTSYAPWVEERRERAEKYSEIISGGDKREILSVMRMLYGAKLKAESEGKKQYIADKRIMNLAEKIIGEEFSYVMDMPKGNIAQYIYERMEQAEA